MAVKITYSTMSADDPELQAAFDAGVEKARSMLGQTHPLFIDGAERFTEGTIEERSPIDAEILIGRYADASVADVDDAVAAAERYQPEWEAAGWRERVAVLRKVGDLLDERQFELAALIAFEVGKSRLEALADVAETAEFFRHHTQQMIDNDGYLRVLGRLSAHERNVSVMRPHGVWGVISPFNFPFALAGGPTVAALATGNTVVLKPSSVGALGGLELYRTMRDAGVPPGAFHVITGRGSVAGDRLVHHPDVDGFTFTGSYDVGMSIFRTFSERVPKPVIAEMGGKNPVIVTATANLDDAIEGVVRGAFGFQGQKCSASSRVYVEAPVFDEFVAGLAARTASIEPGNPIDQRVWMGPVIDGGVVELFRRSVEEATSSGGKVVAGGAVLTEGELGRGHYVQPTVVTAPMSSWLWSRELFMPLVVVGPVDSLDEGIGRANDTVYGLTAGIFAGTTEEIDTFFDGIEAGVAYANRRAGATTGAWPGVQSFGGWKGSGTSGTGFSPWYVRQYLREQSRTVVE